MTSNRERRYIDALMSDLLSYLKENPFVLAPMAGITDRPFRTFMREMGCGVVVTELVSATGLHYSPEKTRRLMQFEEAQHPIGIQLFGENLDHLADAARAVEQMGADFVDLNFGCPVPKVVNKGAGSACLKDLVKLGEVIRSVKSAVRIPVTIKIRTGWDQATRNSHEVVKVAAEEGVTWVAIHGRTRAAQYTGFADWDYIAEVARRSHVPVLGNGDIHTADQAVRRLAETDCKGVLIGRGCLKNPRIFQQAVSMWMCRSGGDVLVNELPFTTIIERLLAHLESFYDERLTLIQIRKFSSWYSAGYPGAAAFRKQLFQLQTRSAVVERVFEYFSNLSVQSQADTSAEPFLMGGHG
jgi:tRNA-dihydrouridine synthase B